MAVEKGVGVGVEVGAEDWDSEDAPEVPGAPPGSIVVKGPSPCPCTCPDPGSLGVAGAPGYGRLDGSPTHSCSVPSAPSITAMTAVSSAGGIETAPAPTPLNSAW